ncbi:hypothetical protein A2841_02090 [Candidatus Kaiserbacteria bacterium RIFCSPHIGHO2_01_FULL_48_10]|uniref:Uncharacterized protein n=1 Tax=Candidatus Kaiserbacteria bacterium RIFCSPHIGHO2_01_FULL_48_10 TaxID=1798476 RepID=A0A1F6C381_9BACT|nr:MAG: hypothetical protein A2841_02090 [Candidatus Kaiserbacteria bacterium RIFCSPHIGHO2_01_FULL_48_10]HLC99692.1 hypothetical protein [Patescibacteria group bacterium]
MQEAIELLVHYGWMGIFAYWLVGIMFYLGLTKELDNLSRNFDVIRHDALEPKYKDMYENLARKNERLDWNPPCVVTLAFSCGRDAYRLWLLKKHLKTQLLFVSQGDIQ